MSSDRSDIRGLGMGDVTRCVDLSTAVRWNQNEGDWRFLLEHAHGVGVEDDLHGLVATTLSWPVGDQFEWINMVIVAAPFRGRGWARKLMRRIIEDTSKRGRIAMLDATDAGAAVYVQLGFIEVARVVRLRRAGGDFSKVPVETPPDGWTVGLAEEKDLEAMQVLDREVWGADRGTLVRTWQQRWPAAAWVLRDPARRVRGFLLGRGGRTAAQLGPLVADRGRDARIMLSHALPQISGPLFMDVPESHLVWLGALNQWGFEPQRRFRRMVQAEGEPMATDWERYFAIAGPDFG